MISRALLLSLLLTGVSHAEIIDRVVGTVGNQVITQSEVIRQTRIAAFLNDEPVDLSAASRRKTAERIIEQELIRREAQLSRYPQPESWEAEKLLSETKAARTNTDAEWTGLLKKYGITEEELIRHFTLQLRALRFTDFRFRPAVQVSESDVREYHTRKYAGRTAPPFEDAREKLERDLIDEKVDQSLDRWLKEARVTTRVEIREDSFQ